MMQVLEEIKPDNITLKASCQDNKLDRGSVILTEYKDRIFNFVLKMTGDYEISAEIAKDAFVEVLCDLKPYEKGDIVQVKLYKKVVEGSLDFLEKNEVSALSGFLYRLKPSERAVILLKDMEGLGYMDISKILDVKLKLVKKKIAIARENLFIKAAL